MWSCFACLTSHPSSPLSPPVRCQKGFLGRDRFWGAILSHASIPHCLPPLFLTWGPWWLEPYREEPVGMRARSDSDSVTL